MKISEYKKKYPELAQETFNILNEHKDTLKELRRGHNEILTKQEKQLFSVGDLQTRLCMAITDREMGDNSWISVLYPDLRNPNKRDRYGRPCGASLKDCSEEQRRAFELQNEILVRCVWEDDSYHWLSDEEWKYILNEEDEEE